MMNEVNCVKRFFDSRHIHVSTYWIECCLEWFREQNSTYTEEYMCNAVLQQWLEADLRDIEVASLPANISKEKKTILNGNFAVQMMYVKDISKSSYSQLKQIRDMYKLTRGVTDLENETSSTGKRVLYLHLTDGVQFMYGFEYQQVPCLDINLTPGIKLLLLGPLLVRNGEFLFKANNVKVLGGEVDDLLIPNAVENVLARELNLPQNPNPGKITQEVNSVTQNIQSQANNQGTCLNQPQANNQNALRNTVQRNPCRTIQQEVVVLDSDDEDNLIMANVDSHFDGTISVMQPTTSKNNANCRNTNTQNELNSDDDIFANIDISNHLDQVENHSTIRDQRMTHLQRESGNNSRNTLNSDSIDEREFMNIDLDNLNTQQNTKTKKVENDYYNFDIADEFELMDRIEAEIKAEQKNSNIPVIETREPFVCIKQLVDNRNKIKNQKFKVKARFTRVVEKLSVNKTKGWSMKFEISDKTGNITVDFLSIVIEELMGLSPAEALNEKRNLKNKVISCCEKLSEAVMRCKDKLKSVEGIMELEFKENKDIPILLSIDPVKQ